MLYLFICLLAFSAWAETAVQEIERAMDLDTQASGLYHHGKYQEAIVLLQQSLAIREKVRGPDHVDTATLLNNLAVVYGNIGQYDKAIPMSQRALAIREKVLGPDHVDTATSLNNLATLYVTIGQYDNSLPLQLRSLRAIEKSLGPDHPLTAASLSNLAELYIALGKYDLALPLHQRALAIREKILGPNHVDTGISINNLAGLYTAVGQYNKALTLFQRALAISESVRGPDHPHTAASLNNLAVLYETLGQYDQALPLYKRALAITEKVLGPDHTDTANSLNNLAFLYQTLGQSDKALPLFQRALAINEKALGPDHAVTALNLNNLAVLYGILGQYEQALPLYQRALATNEKIFGLEHANTANSLNNLAFYYEQTQKSELSLALYQRAYFSALSARMPVTLKLVQSNLGDFYATQSNPVAAIFFFKGAVNSMQSIRVGSHGLNKALQNSLLKKNETIYKRLADLLIESGRLAEAQQVLSMLKEDEYFDFIRRDSQTDIRSTRLNYNRVEKRLAEQLEKLGDDSATLADQLKDLNKQSNLGLTPEQEERRTLIKSEQAEQSRRTIALLSSLAQQLQTTKKQQQIAYGKSSLGQLRATLTSLGHGAVLLQYLVTDTRVRIILTTPQVQIAREAQISAKELNRKIAAFRRVLQNPMLDPRPQAQALYQLLIAPVADDLKQAHAQTLMLSLDGSLRYLPMAALQDGGAYLAEHYSLAIYTDVTKEKLIEKPEAHWQVAGLGITRKIGEFAPLPSVRQELDGIIHVGSQIAAGGVLPGVIYLDNDFTQDRLHNVLNRAYPVLHIASHFVFIPGTEDQSFLLLGDGSQLSLADLRTGGWKFGSVDLMTLSACETALGGGRDENGREIEGFGALAQRQGAKGVLATLWSVSDQSTAILMQSLYRIRQEKGLTKAEALREAQMALLTGKHALPASSGKIVTSSSTGTGAADAPTYIPDPAKPYAHPYYWSPFVLMGNWL